MSTSVRSRRIAWIIAVLLLAWAPARLAQAETRRVAVIVGHNAGGDGERPLRYAEGDASKVADVLVELGDVEPAHLFLLRGRGRDEVAQALARAAGAVKAARRSPEDRVVLLFFYSGHSNASALQLGDTLLSYSELKRLLAATGAEVRLTIVDGCKSGGLVATKGGKPGPAFEIGLTDQLSSVGEATLTSSAADEASLESSEIRGSFFTHHLVSGLRGGADSSGDGRVTLTEAYEYAFNRTVVASAATGSAPQHPSYDYQLSGGGELILTRVRGQSGGLRLPEGFTRALVINVVRDQVIAELTRDKQRAVAVTPGEYAVRLWKGEATFVGRVKAPAGAVTEVTWAQLAPAAQLARTGKGGGGGGDGDGGGVTAEQLEEAHRVLLENALETQRMRERLDALTGRARPPVVLPQKLTWDQRGEDSMASHDRTLAAVDWENLRRAEAAKGGRGSAPPPAGAVLDDELDVRYARYGKTLSPAAQARWDASVLTVRPARGLVLADGSKVVERALYVGRQGLSRPGRREVELPEFLRRAGRADLAEEMSSRSAMRLGLALGGAVAAVGGVIFIVSGEDCAMYDISCEGDNAMRATGGVTLMLAGGALIGLGAIMSDGAPQPHVVQQIADRHNRELRGRLSAESTPPTPSSPTAPSSPAPPAPPAPSKPTSLRLVPAATPSGAGLFVVGQF